MGKWLSRGLIALAALLAIFVGVILVRTHLIGAPRAQSASIDIPEAPAIDAERMAQRLAETIRIRTISQTEGVVDNPAAFEALAAFLRRTYPMTHAAGRLERVAGHSLMFTFAGSDASLPPMLLMGHQDVVPVEAGTEGDWDAPPFSGEIRDGYVIGRGALDDKGSIIAIFEAMEALLTRGFQHRRTIIFFFGHDEEVLGHGAQAAAALLRERGVRPWFVLDEGGAVVTDSPQVGGPAALIGIAEKGYLTVRVIARAEGGHSSRPLADTTAERLSRAILAIRGAPFAGGLDEGPARQMLEALAPRMDFVSRAAIANMWALRPLVEGRVGATPEGDAMLRTTIAPTIIGGGTKENVLPQEMFAVVNLRLHPRDTAEGALAHLRRSVAGIEGVTIEPMGTPTNPSRVSDAQSEAFALISAVARPHLPAGTPIAPYLVGGATDSRHFNDVAENVYRFTPAVARIEDFARAHGTNERMSVENLGRMAAFYAQLMEAGAR
ncbi:MAG: M20 family peptidase [Hyphomonadaceae bacterium]